MNKIFDISGILVNTSPIVIAVLILVVVILNKKEYDKPLDVSLEISIWYFLIISLCSFSGRGNFILSFIITSIFMVYWGSICIDDIKEFAKGDRRLLQIVILLTDFICTIIFLYDIYERLKSKNILEIDFIDNFIYKLSDINYINAFLKIMENEWFKGIATGIITTVVGGLILNKINNKE